MVRLALTAGEAHDNRLAGSILSRLKSGSMLLADRGHDADWIRALVTKRHAWANIPPRSNRNEPICFSPHVYRARNLVERFFNKIKQCRRVALWLRLNESRPVCRAPSQEPGATPGRIGENPHATRVTVRRRLIPTLIRIIATPRQAAQAANYWPALAPCGAARRSPEYNGSPPLSD
jgi:transposase